MMAMNVESERQHTLKGPAVVRGRGLFTGVSATVTIQRAGVDAGISFRRVDLEGEPVIPARIDHVVDRPRRTTLQLGEVTIDTVEHCLSALAGMGVDSAMIDIDGPELPAGDGSAGAFVDAIRDAGIVELDGPRRPLVITEPITVRDGDAMLAALPSDAGESEMMYVLDYGPESVIHRQIHTFNVSPSVYIDQIAPARTFSTRAEAEAMWNGGMFKHLSPRDMLVIGENGPIENSYRFDNEPVRHKVLDLVGDLSLLGRPVQGRFVAVRSGHALNHKMARSLLDVARRLDVTKGRLCGPAQRLVRAKIRILRQIARPPPLRQDNIPRVGPQQSAHRLEQRRLARAVTPHDSDAIARLDRERDPIENDIDPVGMAQIGRGEQWHGPGL